MSSSPPPPWWWCPPDRLHCRHGHPIGRQMRDDGQYVSFRGLGALTYTCTECQPHTHAFGIVCHEVTVLWATSKDGMDRADRLWREQVEFCEILDALGYRQDRRAA